MNGFFYVRKRGKEKTAINTNIIFPLEKITGKKWSSEKENFLSLLFFLDQRKEKSRIFSFFYTLVQYPPLLTFFFLSPTMPKENLLHFFPLRFSSFLFSFAPLFFRWRERKKF
jgi:hypothetical protein